jgi:hypothetical protein
VPILAAFDDSFLRRLLPRFLVHRAEAAAAAAEPAAPVPAAPSRATRSRLPRRPGERAAWGYAVVVAVLSVPTVLNLFSSTQIMNTSFDRLHLVNTYGAFGSVGAVRREIVFEGTDDAAVTATTTWKEYDFWCKPGTPTRRPCVIAPFQPRLDWQIWFAAMSRPERYPWTLHLVAKLLKNDPGALSLLSTNPFPGRPPRFVRAAYYRYEFAPPGNPEGAWWSRQYLGEWLPPLSADDSRLKEFLQAYGW